MIFDIKYLLNMIFDNDKFYLMNLVIEYARRSYNNAICYIMKQVLFNMIEIREYVMTSSDIKADWIC